MSCFGYLLKNFWAYKVWQNMEMEAENEFTIESTNEINYTRVYMLHIISRYLSHFIWYVISVKHVFIIYFHRFAMHFNHIKCLHILRMSFIWLSIFLFFSMVFARVNERNFYFPLDFSFIEIKQLERKNPIGTFTVYYIMIVSLAILRF